MPDRRLLLQRFLGLLLSGPALAGARAADAAPERPAAAQQSKVLRYAFPVAETTFDPVRVSDLYSAVVIAHVFESLYRYDYLARPSTVVPCTAAAMPEVSDDFRTWTIRLAPGIFFADDPAFKGQKRELVAQDYVYAWKRFFDPATISPAYSTLQEEGALGLDALRDEALKGRPFDYDREVEGVRALDRYTLRFKLATPRPRFLYALANNSVAAVAREVVEHYGERVGEHPVGTGPFRLAQWRRSPSTARDRSPSFRALRSDARPAADDAEGQALLARFKGRRLPMVDRVEVSIVEESQPRWLAFLNGEFDFAWPAPLEFINTAVPNGELAPHLAKRGIGMARIQSPDRTITYFNMQDPIVGGMAAEKVALRRAISLSIDVGREIRLIRRGQAVPAQSIVAPGTWGYDPALKTETSDYDPARAQALLDLYGYVDRDGDGWREMPDGSPLVIEYPSSPDATSRQFDELWRRSMDAVGIRLRIRTAQWPENLKAARAGQLMLWQLGSTSDTPDVQDALQMLYGPAAGGQNLARFQHDGFDAIYRRMQALPDGPERRALLREAVRIAAAWLPYKYHVHRVLTDLWQPRLVGYRRPLFGNQWWQYIDIDDQHGK